MKRIFLFIVNVLFLCAFTFSQSNTAKRFALVIGNQSYNASPLANPRADSTLISSVLKDCGFDVTLKQDLTDSQMNEAIGEYATKIEEAGGESISFFYYSGHGVQIDGINYMVPINDEKITSSSLAKAKCYPIDRLLSLVSSSTQIVVLDACRNNPFKDSKTKFTKGLTRIATPKGSPNFLTLFSTEDGATADDGSGVNSLFTECLASRMREYNTEVLSVFNEVSNDVKSKTNGKQTPLVAGTSVKFEFMNAQIAANKIKELQEKQKTLDLDKKAKSSKEYSSEKKMIDAEIALMQEKKAKSEKDAKEKAEKQKKEDEIRKNNQKEMERLQKEAEKQKKDYQAQKAKEKNSLTFIKEIEDNKEKIQKLRVTVADKIYAANVQTQKEADKKIDEIWNAPLGITEKDANGNMNSVTKKRRTAEKKAIEDEAKIEKQKNYDRFYETIKEEDIERSNQLTADEKTLTTAKYIASSFSNEVEFSVSDYDGQKNKWTISFKSKFMDKPELFSGTIDLTYEQLCTKVLKKKYIVPAKMNSIDIKQYESDISLYDGIFKSKESPLLLEVEYKMNPKMGSVSAYNFSTTTVFIKYNGENIIELNKASLLKGGTIQWNEKQTEIKTVSEIIKGYEKRDAPPKESPKITSESLKNWVNSKIK